MTTQPSVPRPLPAPDDRPSWQVAAMLDPDGAGQDSAFTLGLHERGRPVPRQPLSAADEARVRRHAAELLGGRTRTIAGRRLPAPGHDGHRLSTAPDQAFGPRHACVVARAADMVRADPHTWARAVVNELCIVEMVGARLVPAAARGVSRPLGLLEAVEAVDAWAQDVAVSLLGRRRATWRWRDALDHMTQQLSRPEAAELRPLLELTVLDLISDALVAEVLGDDAPLDLQRAALGAWEVARGGRIGPLDPRWRAPADALEAVSPWCGERLLPTASRAVAEDPESVETLIRRARAVGCLGGACAPPLREWIALESSLGALLRDQPVDIGSALAALAQTALAHEMYPGAFTDDQRALLGSWGLPGS